MVVPGSPPQNIPHQLLFFFRDTTFSKDDPIWVPSLLPYMRNIPASQESGGRWLCSIFGGVNDETGSIFHLTPGAGLLAKRDATTILGAIAFRVT